MKNTFYALSATLLLLTSCGSNPDTLSQNPPHTPTEGPYTHQIYGLESADGLTWTQANAEPLAEHASVPTVGMVDGDMMVYYVDATNGPEELGCLSSSNNGKSFTQETCALEGTPTGRNVDFSFVPDNGELRLYYYSVKGELADNSDHAIRYATSPDGFTFTDQGEVFSYPGLVDPDVFYNGEEWIIHVFSLTDAATIVATSQDGTNFTNPTHLALESMGVAKPVAIDGGFRMYAFKQGEQTAIYSFFSKDGLDWTQEDGTRWQAPADYEITDPSVIQLPDGTYKMVYKISAKPKKN